MYDVIVFGNLRMWGARFFHPKSSKPLRAISIRFFFLVISILWKSQWSWELRTWSHKMGLFDILSTSAHYFCRKWIGATNESSNFDLRPGLIEPPYNEVLGIANDIPYPSFSRIYMEKNLDSTKPRYCAQILSVPWLFGYIAVPLYR